MTKLFYRATRMTPPKAVRGEGVYIFDTNGKRYLDAIGGAAVSCLGHGHAGVNRAMEDQLKKIAFTHTSFFTTEAAEELGEMMVAHAPPGIGRVCLVSGGSEAVESAIKLARQYFVEIGQPQRRNFIARWQSYHGATLGTLAIGGNIARRGLYEPLLIESHHVSPCYSYRDKREGETDEQYGQRLVQELEEKILQLGPDTIAAFVVEPVVGATLGAVPPVPGYLKGIREVLDRYSILMIADEVMCGMGRTGTLYAMEQDGITADLITVAKGLGAGYQPIGALLVSQKIFDAVDRGSGVFHHGYTYMAHPVACAAAIAVQRALLSDGLLANVIAQGERLMTLLKQRFANHYHVGDIRGRGLFIGLEFVKDRTSKEPFAPALRLNAKIKAEALARGLCVYTMGGTIAGKAGDHALLAPPFILNEGHCLEIVELLGDAVEAAIVSCLGQEKTLV